MYLKVNIFVNSHAHSLLLSDHLLSMFLFNESMPALRSSLPTRQKFAIMRLDGDLYQSTVDVLYTLYDHLSVGGYVIMDDWNGFPSKTACEHFFMFTTLHQQLLKSTSFQLTEKKQKT